jgi:hypothetical protein
MKHMENQSLELDVVEHSSLESISRAEVDMKITTARRYPRIMSKVKQDMLSFATLDEETAAACFFTIPRGGKTIQGPSVRLAEIAVSAYQNITAASRVLNVVSSGENPHVVIQAVCHDLQNNVTVSIEKRRAINSKKNHDGSRKPVSDDDIQLAVNACSAIAFRDSVFKVIPQALIKPVYEAAKRVAVGEVKSLVTHRQKVIDRLKQMGATEERILAVVDARKVDDVTVDKLEVLVGLGTAIKDGVTTLEEAFPAIGSTAAQNNAEAPKRGTSTMVAMPKQREPDPSPTVVVSEPEPSNTSPSDNAGQKPPKPTTSSNEAFTQSMLNAGVDLTSLIDVCELKPNLKANTAAWLNFSDVSDADAAFIVEHLDVSTPGELKWKTKRAK